MAHLLEHMLFKGTPEHPNIPQELTAHGARANGIDLVRPHQLLRDASGDRREPRLGARLEADRMVNSLRRQEGPRHRDDRRPQRVRDGRERPERDPRGAHRCRPRSSGTTTASRRSARAPTSSTCRSSGCRRSTGSTTSPTTRCSSSPASSTRRRRSRSIDETFGTIPKPDAHAAELPTRVEPAQDGERSVTLRRVGDVQALAAAYHVPAGHRSRSAGASNLLEQILTDTPSGRLYKALVETKKATVGRRLLHGAARPGLRDVRRRGPPGPGPRRTRRRRSCETLDDAAGAAPITEEEVERARATS